MRPKQILPGQCLMATRRTLNREFLLTPNRRVSEAFGYFLAVAANLTDTGVWGGVLMSNHPHLGLVDNPNADPDQRVGSRDKFFQILHGEFAKWRNQTIILDGVTGRTRRGQFWDGERVNEVRLMGSAIEERILYMLMNPQRAGIVRHIHEWTGFMIRPRDWGRTLTFRRPVGAPATERFPEVASLRVMRPPIRWELTTDELRIHATARLRVESAKEHASRLALGLTDYMGMKACRRQRPTTRPRTPSGDPAPRVLYAAGDPEVEEKARAAKLSFDKTYAEQRKRLKEGLPVEFPAGSVRLPRLFNLPLAPVKPGEPTVLPNPPP